MAYFDLYVAIFVRESFQEKSGKILACMGDLRGTSRRLNN
jgi:hypothetical protein